MVCRPAIASALPPEAEVRMQEHARGRRRLVTHRFHYISAFYCAHKTVRNCLSDLPIAFPELDRASDETYTADGQQPHTPARQKRRDLLRRRGSGPRPAHPWRRQAILDFPVRDRNEAKTNDARDCVSAHPRHSQEDRF